MTVPARAAGKILHRLTALGASAAEACRKCGFDPGTVEGAENRMPFRQLCELYEAAAEVSDDASFGLRLAGVTALGQFDVLGYAASASRDLAEALGRLVRYYRIWCDAAEVETAERTDGMRVTYRVLLPDPPFRQDAEFTLAMIVTSFRALTGQPWRPDAVEFRHPAPVDLAEHRRLFQCDLRFGAPDNVLLCPRATARMPVLTSDPDLLRMVDRHAEDLLRTAPAPEGFRSQVREAILRALPGGEPRLQTVARSLGSSARTLQRRLEACGTSYESMVDAERRVLAESYLGTAGLSLAEVAYLLGFSEASAFHRAFKRWSGVTPAQYRHALSRKPVRSDL